MITTGMYLYEVFYSPGMGPGKEKMAPFLRQLAQMIDRMLASTLLIFCWSFSDSGMSMLLPQ